MIKFGRKRWKEGNMRFEYKFIEGIRRDFIIEIMKFFNY